MKNLYARSIAVAFLLLLSWPMAAAAAKQEPAPSPRRAPHTIRYPIRFLDIHVAEVLAWDQCQEKDRCGVSSAVSESRSYIDFQADPEVHEKFVRALAKEDSTPVTQVFQLVLVAAGSKGGGPAATLTPGAQKAMADLQGFLPYKGYEVLDSVYFRGTQGDVIQGRAVGRRELGYGVTLRFRRVGTSQDKNLLMEAFQLAEEGSRPIPLPSGGARDPREVIDTSFSLKVGETVVVGTSRLDGGDEALIVLLTAVP
jgi:hypothetical protein